MNVLLVGNGAREHAIAEALARSPRHPALLAFMKANNPGIAALSHKTAIGAYSDFSSVLKLAKEADFAVIGPEDPLEAGIVDFLEENGVPCFGPKRDLAQLETSKSFTRELFRKYKIPGAPKFRVCFTEDEARDFLEELGGDYVVKADGLMGGKGVKLSGEHLHSTAEALAYARDCIKKHGRVVVEEKLVGEEFSIMAFCDGRTVKDSQPSQDHKRAFDGDKGPNTGGMGSYSTGRLLPFLTEADLAEAHDIAVRTCHALREQVGEEYKGVMYGGFMATKGGVKLVEFNARFGDPEVMNVLPLMQSDFVEVCQAVIDGDLEDADLRFSENASVCKYIVPEGYPDSPVKGERIEVPPAPKARVYYASVDQRPEGLFMSSSRALAFVGIAPTLKEAERIAQSDLSKVKGRVHYRSDIGTQALVNKRIAHMRQLRGQ
jgi:phosphoribosylamine--glycine ligase